MTIYYVVVFGNFKARLYIHSLKSDRRWALTKPFEKAFRFDYPHYAFSAIESYCNMYGAGKENFRVLKIVEEPVTQVERNFASDFYHE